VSVFFARRAVAPLMRDTARVRAKLVLAEALPYFVNSVSVQMRNLDVYLVTAVGSAVTAGLYASARRLMSPLLLLPTAMATVLMPAIARSSATAHARVLKSITLTSFVALPVYIGIALLLPWALPLTLGEPYRDATPAAQALVLALPFAVAGSLLTSYLQGQGQARVTARIAVIATAYNLGGIWFGVTLGGLVGAAIATATTSAVQVVLQVGWLVRSSGKVHRVDVTAERRT
jgi:O-antigen/teichoic acid export membrane protein